jgi:hypothetical protein
MKFRLFVGQPTPTQQTFSAPLTTWQIAPTLSAQGDAEVTRLELASTKYINVLFHNVLTLEF